MPRCPARDYADRCAAIELQQRGLRQCEIAATLQRPLRWVRRTVDRYDAAVGVASLRDHSSRPHRSPTALRWLIYRLAMQNDPARLRLIMVDKKGHDLAPYFGKLAHLAHPVVRDPLDGARLLAWASLEMDRRLAANRREPKLVVVIEEIGDLIMVNGEVEGFLARIAQLGRAAGVHLVVTTQQPGARSLGGALTNFTARLLGRVATATKTFGAAGRAKTMADLLLGRGDFLLITAGGEIRLQVPYSHGAHYGRLPHVAQPPTLEEELPALLHLADLQRDPRGRNGQTLDLAAVEEALVQGLSAGALAARLGIGHERARRLYAAYHEREDV